MIGKTNPRTPTSARETWLTEMPRLVAAEPRPDGREAWRARTSVGAEVIAVRVSASEVGSVSRYVERLRELHQGQDSYLTALAGAAEDGETVWLLYRPVAATSLARALEGEGGDTARAVAMGIGVLHGLATLQRCGLGRDVDAESVLVDTMGLPRIDGPFLPADADDARRQVRMAGGLLCRLLGLPERGTASLLPIERQAPALAAVARSLAAGSIADAASATELLAEGGGGLTAPAQVSYANAQLAERVRSVLSEPQPPRVRREPPLPDAPSPPLDPSSPRHPAPASPEPAPPAPQASPQPVFDSFPAAPPPAPSRPAEPRGAEPRPAPSAPPAPAGGPAPPATPRREAPRRPAQPRPSKPIVIGPRPSRESTWRAKPPPSRRRRFPAVPLMVAGLIVLLIVVGVIGVMRMRGNGQAGFLPTPRATPSAAASTAPTPPPGPPASAGDVRKVEFNFDQPTPCSPGDRACQLHVQVDTNPLPRASTIAWSFVITDLCTGRSTTATGNQVEAGAGWTYVWANNVVQLPAGKRMQIVAQTSEPAVAASTPLVIGQSRC